MTVNLALRSIRYFVTLEFSIGKCLTVSSVIFLMAIPNKSKGLSLSCIQSSSIRKKTFDTLADEFLKSEMESEGSQRCPKTWQTA